LTRRSGQALESPDQRFGPINSRGLAQLAYEKGTSVLVASQAYQAALERARLGHGVLTLALIEEGLRPTWWIGRQAMVRSPHPGPSAIAGPPSHGFSRKLNRSQFSSSQRISSTDRAWTLYSQCLMPLPVFRTIRPPDAVYVPDVLI
jgi:hypothetical protein